MKVTLDKYGVYSATYYNWKKNYDLFQADGLDIKALGDAQKEIKRLKTELMHYKSMLAEEQLKGRMKDEMIKKKYPNRS
ncbi:transposase [Portibacter marinus]|uniref:transposase n=1 Tax=Portibacter marinus TaxID=2898660 RepID=UPI001F2F7068|nr:transposase [Portibacter marinus]